MHPKWFPVFYTLSKNKEKTITEIAYIIGHSHPSVIKIIREMTRKGYIITKNDKSDGRKNVVALSKKGKEIIKKIQDLYVDVNNAIETVLKETKNNLWYAIAEWEFALNQKSLIQRVSEKKKQRESQNIKIVEYKPKYHQAYKQLNVEWISTYFKMEEADYKALDHPKKYILDNGGYIFIALDNRKPVGTCALIKMNNPVYDYELAKMAVSTEVRGKGIGWLLGRSVIEKAESLGAKRIYLESNTMLIPAINLYRKLGFKEIIGLQSPYERCNIQMELILQSDQLDRSLL